MKGKMKKVFAATLAGIMGMSFTACALPETGNGKTGTYSYLAIDINPSIEFMVNGKVVVGVKACNDDAAVLLSGENLEDMTVEEATKKVVELAEELGYLNADNDDVKITVTSDDDTTETELKRLAKRGAGKGSELAKINHIPRFADETAVNKLKGKHGEKFKDLTAGKLRLIEAIMKYDETMTYEEGVEMSVSELSKILDSLVEETGDVIGKEMEELFENKYKEIKKLYEEQIADIYAKYDENYKAIWNKVNALEDVVKQIEKTAKKLTIKAEDVEKLMEIFGITLEEGQPDAGMNPNEDANQPNQPENEGFDGQGAPVQGEMDKRKFDHLPEFSDMGEWDLEAFHHFFDRFEDFYADNEKYEELFEEAEEILEAYDKDDYVLTEDDLALIAETWGETIELTTFEDLEEFLEDQEEVLEELRETIEEENPQVKTLLKALMETIKDFRKEARNCIKGQLESKKGEFRSRKEALRGRR